jgi:uncharacterized protein YkwD
MPWLRSIAIALALTALLAPASQAGRHERELRTLVNGERAGHGVAKLRPAPALARSARRHARALLARGVLAHAPLTSGAARFRILGENLAMTGGLAPKPRRAVALWLGSPGHRALMLHPRMRSIGIGRASGSFNGRPATVWVLRLGAR